MSFADRSRDWLASEHHAAPASPMYQDAAQEVPEGKRIPVPRSEQQALISLVQLAQDQLVVSRQILAALGASSDSRSSVEVKTSARGVDIASKCYANSSMDGLSDRAVTEYFATLEKVQARIDAHAAAAVP